MLVKTTSISTKNLPTINVVIPNWNGADVIGDCLRSLERQTVQPTQTIMVENGSAINK